MKRPLSLKFHTSITTFTSSISAYLSDIRWIELTLRESMGRHRKRILTRAFLHAEKLALIENK